MVLADFPSAAGFLVPYGSSIMIAHAEGPVFRANVDNTALLSLMKAVYGNTNYASNKKSAR